MSYRDKISFTSFVSHHDNDCGWTITFRVVDTERDQILRVGFQSGDRVALDIKIVIMNIKSNNHSQSQSNELHEAFNCNDRRKLAESH